MIGDNQIHYTSLALQEGYSIDVNTGEFFAQPNGELVANDPAIWEQVVIPAGSNDYVAARRAELPSIWMHAVVGFDFYHYTKDFWLRWGNVMPYPLE